MLLTIDPNDPEAPNAREAYFIVVYLDEVEKFKNMIRDCDTEGNGVSYEEGIICLRKYVSISNLNFPC